MGRGFAVVADEVRKLAERVNVATQEITENIGGMISLVQETQTENETINADIRQTREVVERSSTEFSRMVGDFERTGDQLDQIATAIEQLTATNAQVHEAVLQVNDLSKEVSVTMKSSEQSTVQLGIATESVQELVSRFKIGRGTFDQNVDVVIFVMLCRISWSQCRRAGSMFLIRIISRFRAPNHKSIQWVMSGPS